MRSRTTLAPDCQPAPVMVCIIPAGPVGYLRAMLGPPEVVGGIVAGGPLPHELAPPLPAASATGAPPEDAATSSANDTHSTVMAPRSPRYACAIPFSSLAAWPIISTSPSHAQCFIGS